jgi:pimeloyl-ACP methyl ester carboxylesterase
MLPPLLALTLMVGCTGGSSAGANHPQRPTAVPSAVGASGSPSAGTAGLTGSRACQPGFTCATLSVPLDRAHPDARTLPLRVAMETDRSAPRGVLLALTGGPGQGGVSFAPTIAKRVGPEVMAAYRLVMLDQRGTGNTALRCPALQQAMGFSDLTPPPAAAVAACAQHLGPDRRFYSTEDVVGDLDQLRSALGAARMTVFGVSYGTFVAEHYSLAHPGQTRALVLDSVVPHVGIDPLAVDLMQASRRVLRDACRDLACPGDPVADLADVIARYDDGVDLLDLVTAMSIVDPTFAPLLPALRSAADGNTGQLDRLVAGYHSGMKGPAGALSQGLHASALCADMSFPWGGSDAPLAGRAAAVTTVASGLAPADLSPFDRATAVGNGLVRQCLPWPPVPPAGLPSQGALPDVPVLLLAGTHDLSTPLEWARAEAALAPDGKLVVFPGLGHSVVSQGHAGQAVLRDFLLGPAKFR